MEKILRLLEENRDEKNAAFQAKLMPGIDPEKCLGVRTPALRKLAKELLKEGGYEPFLKELPHEYFDENQLHGFLISEMKDYDRVLAELEQFLPYVNNWATCDQTSPRIFKKKKGDLITHIYRWIDSEHPYIRRFGIGMIMEHFLDEEFQPEYLDRVCAVRSGEYYVNMEIAWCMATALAKQWDAAVKHIENHSMDTWTHNKTIQKARESYRITPEQKEYLNGLKIR